ncbi:TPA: hypothetical protein ACKP4Y_006297, partial [Pseudomonas aeruginosa]
ERRDTFPIFANPFLHPQLRRLSFDLVHLILQPRYRSLVDDRASRRCANVRPYFPYFLKPE